LREWGGRKAGVETYCDLSTSLELIRRGEKGPRYDSAVAKGRKEEKKGKQCAQMMRKNNYRFKISDSGSNKEGEKKKRRGRGSSGRKL